MSDKAIDPTVWQIGNETYEFKGAESMRDAIDNRNMVILEQTYLDATQGMPRDRHMPSRWPDQQQDVILRAMRKAGDEALFDQVRVRLERSFNSTCDVRDGASLVVPVGIPGADAAAPNQPYTEDEYYNAMDAIVEAYPIIPPSIRRRGNRR